MALIDAYDTRTGKKVPHRVPEHFVGHPALGPHLSKTPRQKAAERKNTTTQTPAAGDTEKE